jgi:hypothetical protein
MLDENDFLFVDEDHPTACFAAEDPATPRFLPCKAPESPSFRLPAVPLKAGASAGVPATPLKTASTPRGVKRRACPDGPTGIKIAKQVTPFQLGLVLPPQPGAPVRRFDAGQAINSVTWYQTKDFGEVVKKVEKKYGPSAAMCAKLYEAQAARGSDALSTVPLHGAVLESNGCLTTYWAKSSDPHPSEGCLSAKLMPQLITKTLTAMELWRDLELINNDIKSANCFWNKKTNSLQFIDWGNGGQTGDVEHWHKDPKVMKLILACDQALKGKGRYIYDQILAVFFIGFYMAKLTFKQVMDFTRSVEFSSRFPEVAGCIADINDKSEAIDRAMRELEKNKKKLKF